MTDLSLMFFYYFIILFSIIGYGHLTTKIFKNQLTLAELGFNGLLIIIIISYITNFFFTHLYIHNLIVLFVGLIFFINLLKKKISKKNYFLLLIVSLILFIGLLMHKNHDDFYYYHFPYTLSIIEFKKIIGLGNLEHGFRTPSSIFYLNSIFFLPKIDLALINSGAIYYLIFANIFFLQKIFNQLRKKNLNFIFYLSFLSFIITNTAFYRLAEHGTDRSALILVFILAIYYLDSLNKKFDNKKKVFFNFYPKIIIVILLIVSLKSFYLIYYVFIISLIFEFRKYILISDQIKKLLFNRHTYYFIFATLIFLFTVFLNTGCFVYPASFTCFESTSWSIPKQQVQDMRQWYELWSKAGANPNYRVDNQEEYLNGLNWFTHWFKEYFFTKVSEFLFVVFLISLITFFTLKGNTKKLPKKVSFSIFYFLILMLGVEWFLNHPTLRYGGFSLIALIFFIPLSIYMEKNFEPSNSIFKKSIILIFITFSIFFIKNVNRISNEVKKYNYKPFSKPHYHVIENAYFFRNMILRAKEIDKDRKSFYLVLTKDLIKKVNNQ